MAADGPMPMMRGGTPATVAPTNLAKMGWPSSMALERFIRRTPAAGVWYVSGDQMNGCYKGEILPPSVT